MRNEEQKEIKKTLASFIQDFNNLDMEKVGAYFADDATIFPRVVMSGNGSENIVLSEFLREEGAGPDRIMKKFANQLKTQSPGPPYMTLEPEDVLIQVIDGTAIVTFHFITEERLSRRTFVLVRRDDAWKIIHLHASNVHMD